MERILIGKKGKDIEPGYVWVPYIIQTSPVVIDSNFNTTSIKSRYGVIETKPQIRSRKIKNILKKYEHG